MGLNRACPLIRGFFSVVNPTALHGLQFSVISTLVLQGTVDVQGPLSTHEEGRLQVALGLLTTWGMLFSSQLCKDAGFPHTRGCVCESQGSLCDSQENLVSDNQKF